MGRVALLLVFDEADPEPIYVAARDADGYAATCIDPIDQEITFRAVLELAGGIVRMVNGRLQIDTIPADLAAYSRALVDLLDAP